MIVSLAEIALIHRNRTCKTGLQFAIFEIQAYRECSKGAQWLSRNNAGKNNFVGPKMTPPDSAVSVAIGYYSLAEVALIRRNRTCKTSLQFAIFEIQAYGGCSKGAQWSSRHNAGKNNFVGPKMTPLDSAISFSWA